MESDDFGAGSNRLTGELGNHGQVVLFVAILALKLRSSDPYVSHFRLWTGS